MAMQRSGGGDRPVVLALVEDRVGSLASLLLAADIATAREASLFVVHIRPPRLLIAGTAGLPVPPSLLAEADRLAADVLREKVACLLALTPAEWTFTWTVGRAHRTVTSLVSTFSPVAVVGAPRRRQSLFARSVARWLISRDIPAIGAAA